MTASDEAGIGPVRARERFMLGEPVEGGVRNLILDSWQRCQSMGISPDGSELPYRPDIDLDGRLVRAARPVLDRLASRFAGSRMNVALADADGAVLERRFGEASMVRQLPAIQSVPGFVFAEQYGGTNGIGLALTERRLIQVSGAEHFAERGQSNACTAIPVRDPLSGRIEGVLCFAYPPAYADPQMEDLIRKAATAIERRLLAQSSARERTLLRAYLDSRRRAETGQAAGEGRLAGLDELPRSGLDRHDQTLLEQTATELISSARRTAVEVTLSQGRRATLLSRPVVSPSGVEGFVIEAVLYGDSLPRLVTPDQAGPSVGLPEPATTTAVPPLSAAATDHGAEALSAPARGAATRLLLLGEPGVGQYAVAARRRLELLSEASTRIGTTLNVTRTAWELAEMAVPRLADYVTIDLPETVLRGEEPTDPGSELHRTVVHGIRADCPFYPVGERVDLSPTTPHRRCLASGQAVLEPDLRRATGWISQDPGAAERLLAHHVHSLITVPLLARGVVLGIAGFYRARNPAPYGDDDRSLAQELATRAAICIDNARRYTREHAMVLALQHSLLPRSLPEQSAIEVAHRYLPAESGVRGDWFDVIPLSGARVALVVGDVVGRGLHAAATMGRLRTAVHNFAELDLAPDELLTHLDNLVGRLDRDEDGVEPATGNDGIIGASCLYAVYDPTSQRCTLARAGHPPPAVVHPDGTVTVPDLPAGPPLGLGGLPFETAELHLPEGSQLVLYSDGLLEDHRRDPDAALDRLRTALAQANRSPEDTCRTVVDAVVPEHPADDVTLLVARTHALDPGRIATWDLPADPARVGDIRAAAARRLSDWGLEEVAFVTELLLSELVTNAIRYGTEPIRIRLIHDRALICEVSDGSSTAPHLRHAATTDEGGRGLFLVAQLTQAWGTRYTARGKVIWAECALEASDGVPDLFESHFFENQFADIPEIE
ncbi:SpoIIE family protein phosphatase [Kitasatospora sp. NPDC057542]|uniref:SpoIIE family protein phosphatase n=1 Tax=Streptomycetaceae TaxID=2062 RepID=UPI001CCC54AA|nr:SpoIIE family protein phosphatase [Streptomyces sp. LS1784]